MLICFHFYLLISPFLLFSTQHVKFIPADQLLSILALLCSLQTGWAVLQREWFMPLNEWMKSHIFPIFKFGLLRDVTTYCAALF